MLYILLAIDSITAQFMKDQTVLFGRLTHKDGYNAAIGLTVFIKQESMKQGQFWNIQEVSCVLYFIC
jgi:hypothetical protein